MRISDWSSDVCSSDLDKGEVDMGEAQLEIEHYWAGALRRAVIDGDVENGSLMAGQSVGMVSEEESAAAIVASLVQQRSEEHTSELQSLMRISYAVFCLNKKNIETSMK